MAIPTATQKTMGACLLANELSGEAKAILQARADGKSWATIAQEQGYSNPGAARKAFTKLTGSTDYKTTGAKVWDLIPDATGSKPAKVIAKKDGIEFAKIKAAPEISLQDKVVKEALDQVDTAVANSSQGFIDELLNLEAETSNVGILAEKLGVSKQDIYDTYDFLAGDTKELSESIVSKWKAAKVAPIDNPLAVLADPAEALSKAKIPDLGWDSKEDLHSFIDNLYNEQLTPTTSIADQFGVSKLDIKDILFEDPSGPAWQKAMDNVWEKVTGTPVFDSAAGVVKQEVVQPLVTDAIKAKYDQAKYLFGQGKTYAQISSETGLGIPEIDSVVFRSLQDKWMAQGFTPEQAMWKAFIEKPTSYNGYNSVKNAAQEMFGKGLANVDEVASAFGMDKQTATSIYNDTWAKPKPGTTTYHPPTPQSPSYASVSGSTPNADLPKMTTPKDLEQRYYREDELRAWYGSHTDDSKDSFRAYSGSAYTPINNLHRYGHENSTMRRLSGHMDAAMKPLPSDAVVIRNTAYDAFSDSLVNPETGLLDETAVGKTFADPAYLSTAFAEGTFTHKPVRMVIKIPQGAPASLLKPISAFPDENEVLLGRNIKMVCESSKRVQTPWGPKWELVLQVVGW